MWPKIKKLLVLGLELLHASYEKKHVKEPRAFLSSLDRFLISGLVFLNPDCNVLNKALIYNTRLAKIDIVFSTRILDDS